MLPLIQPSGGTGGGGVGGSTGASDNRVLRSDGAGGATAQASDLVLADDESLSFGGAGATNPAIVPTVAAAPRFAMSNGDGTLQAGLCAIRRSSSIADGVEVALPNNADGRTLYRLTVATTRTVLLSDTAQIGWDALFVVPVASGELIVQAPPGHVINVAGSASTSGGTATSTQKGAALLLCYADTSLWIGIASGTWTLA